MGLEEGNSSGAVSSENQTPKSLKAKPKLSKKAVVNSATRMAETKDTPGRKKVLKKKIVAVRKGKNSKKEDVQNADSVDMENKNDISGDQGKNNQENTESKSVPGSEKVNDVSDTAVAQNLNGEKIKEEENKNVVSGEQGKNNHENLEKKSVPESEKVNDMSDTAVAQNINGKKIKEEENKNVISREQGKNNHENLENKGILESEKTNNMKDTKDAQNLNEEKLKEDIKSNSGNLKRKKKVIIVRKKIKKGNKEGSKALKKDESEFVVSAEKSEERPEIEEGSKALNKEEPESIITAEKNKKRPAIEGGSKALNKEEPESIITAEKIKKRPAIEGGSKALYKEESESVITAEKRKKRPDIGLYKVPIHENNTENFDASRNNQLKQDVEDRSGLSRKQNNQMNKEKLSGSVKKEQRNKKADGLILFCNTKTKSDCFRYHIMGVSSSRKDLVLDIKPGLKLFLYDFDIKLLYGIYSASSPCGTKLEPAAFNGSFPFQVRFEIYKDCYPLPESVFKRAIKENYGNNNKFGQELTSQQVYKLVELFKPTEVKQHALPLYPPQSMSVDKGEAKESEAEYYAHPRREPLARQPNAYDNSRRYDSLLNKNAEGADRPAPSAQKRESSPAQLFLSEKDYRMYGLRRQGRNVSPPRSHVALTLGLDSRTQEHLSVLPSREAGKEYHTAYSHPSLAHISASTASIVDSYLKVPYYGSSKDPYQNPPRSEREEVALGSYSLGRRETAYQPEISYLLRRENQPNQRDYIMEASEGKRREKDEGSALYSSYASKAHSEHNQVHVSERAMPETSSFAPVSSRYSFAGPSSRYL